MTKPCLFLRGAWIAAFAFASAVCAFAADAAKKNYEAPAGDAAVTLKAVLRAIGRATGLPGRRRERRDQRRERRALGSRRARAARRRHGIARRARRDDRRAGGRTRAAGATGFGAVEGRVFNLGAGSYVNNARVTIDAWPVGNVYR